MLKLTKWLAAVATFSLLLMTASAGANPFLFSYGGRLTDNANKGVAGPVDMELKFYRSAAGGSPIGVSPVTFSQVRLDDGVFQVDVSQLTADEYNILFDGDKDTFVEVTDKTHNDVYPRQKMQAVPFAMKVPVDGRSINYDAKGNLSVGPSTAPGSNQFLTKDGNGSWIWASPSMSASSLGSFGISPTAPSSGQVLQYDGQKWTPTTPTGNGILNLNVTGPLSYTAPNLTLNTVPVSSGGTGTSSLTSGALFLGNGSGSVQPLVGTTTGQVVTWDNGLSRWSASSVPAPDWSNPGPIGSGSQNSGQFSSLFASGVGIGTTAPTARVEIQAADNNAGNYAFKITGTPFQSLWVNDAGNVGIGTNPTGWALTSTSLYLNTNAALGLYNSGGSDYGLIKNVGANQWSVGSGPNSTTFSNQALTWTSSGNVGIGTTAPTTNLDVNGGIHALAINVGSGHAVVHTHAGAPTGAYAAQLSVNGGPSCTNSTPSGGGWISGIGAAQTGQCDITFTGGVFSMTPICVCSAVGTGDFSCTISGASSTGASVRFLSAGSAYFLGDINLICMGQ